MTAAEMARARAVKLTALVIAAREWRGAGAGAAPSLSWLEQWRNTAALVRAINNYDDVVFLQRGAREQVRGGSR